MSLEDSILQTALITRCVSVVATPTDHIIFIAPLQGDGVLPLSDLKLRDEPTYCDRFVIVFPPAVF
jgi:hypothetical protein